MRQQSTEDDNGFADADELFETVVEMLSATQTIQQDTVDGRPAADVLTERLNQMEWPEFFLLAHGVLRTNDVEPMAAAWLEEMHATCDEEPEE